MEIPSRDATRLLFLANNNRVDKSLSRSPSRLLIYFRTNEGKTCVALTLSKHFDGKTAGALEVEGPGAMESLRWIDLVAIFL